MLKFIVDKGVKEGVLADDVIREISEHITRDLMSDVRKGKNLVYASVQETMNEGKENVTSAHIEKALVAVRDKTLTQILANFTKADLLALA